MELLSNTIRARTNENSGLETRPVGSISWALASLCLSMLLASLGTSSANIALPTIAETFRASFHDVQWVIVAYLVAMTSSSVIWGRLGDVWGRQRLLRAGLLVFSMASLASALASALWIVVVARAVQGLGAAIMMALTLAFVSEIVPKEKTGTAMGLLGTTSAVGTALGPSLGGVLIHGLGWRAIFLTQVLLGLLAFALVSTQLRSPARKPAAPLLRLHLFRDTALKASLFANWLVSTVAMTNLVVGPFYLSYGMKLEPGTVGVVLSVGPSVSALAGFPAGRLVDRFGPHRMTLAGLFGIALGDILLSRMPLSWGMVGFVLPMVMITASYALFQAANNTAVMQNLDPSVRGVISGTLSLSRNLGLTTGACLMGAVFAMAAGTSDISAASPNAVSAGMRGAYSVAATLMFSALLIVALAQSRAPRGGTNITSS